MSADTILVVIPLTVIITYLLLGRQRKDRYEVATRTSSERFMPGTAPNDTHERRSMPIATRRGSEVGQIGVSSGALASSSSAPHTANDEVPMEIDSEGSPARVHAAPVSMQVTSYETASSGPLVVPHSATPIFPRASDSSTFARAATPMSARATPVPASFARVTPASASTRVTPAPASTRVTPVPTRSATPGIARASAAAPARAATPADVRGMTPISVRLSTPAHHAERGEVLLLGPSGIVSSGPGVERRASTPHPVKEEPDIISPSTLRIMADDESDFAGPSGRASHRAASSVSTFKTEEASDSEPEQKGSPATPVRRRETSRTPKKSPKSTGKAPATSNSKVTTTWFESDSQSAISAPPDLDPSSQLRSGNIYYHRSPHGCQLWLWVYPDNGASPYWIPVSCGFRRASDGMRLILTKVLKRPSWVTEGYYQQWKSEVEALGRGL